MEPHEEINSQRNDECGSQRIGHMPDMREQGDFVNGRGHVGRIRKRGHLVAKEGAADDRCGGNTGVEAKPRAYSHQGEADGPDRAVRSPRKHGGHGTKDEAGRQKELRGNDLQADIDHYGDGARRNPGADQGPYGHHDQYGPHGPRDEFVSPRFQLGIRESQIPAEPRANDPAAQHEHLKLKAKKHHSTCDDGDDDGQDENGKAECQFLANRLQWCRGHDAFSCTL